MILTTYSNANDNHPVRKDFRMRSSPPQDFWNSLDTTEDLRDTDDDVKQNWYEFRETVWKNVNQCHSSKRIE